MFQICVEYLTLPMVTSDVRFFLFGGQFSACKIDVAI